MERLPRFDRSVTLAALIDCPNCSEAGNNEKLKTKSWILIFHFHGLYFHKALCLRAFVRKKERPRYLFYKKKRHIEVPLSFDLKSRISFR